MNPSKTEISEERAAKRRKSGVKAPPPPIWTDGPAFAQIDSSGSGFFPSNDSSSAAVHGTTAATPAATPGLAQCFQTLSLGQNGGQEEAPSSDSPRPSPPADCQKPSLDSPPSVKEKRLETKKRFKRGRGS